MTETLERKLERLYNRRTAYELVISNGAITYLLCYAEARTRKGIFLAVNHRCEKLVPLTGVSHIDFAKRVADGAMMGTWSIRFSGRTQREAYIGGELTYVGSL